MAKYVSICTGCGRQVPPLPDGPIDTAPVLVVDGLKSVQRLSRLSDGLVLVCHTDGSLSTLDTESGAVTALRMPALSDPATGAALSGLLDTVADPSGKRLAFSASLGEPDTGTTRRCIFISEVNGGKLRRLTPLESQFVPAYRFAESGLTAADVEWEDL